MDNDVLRKPPIAILPTVGRNFMTDLNNLGVEKGKVTLSDFQANWNMNFRNEQNYLSNILSISTENIFHIGSTAIRNCKAKPIIDIAIPYQRLADSFSHQQVLAKTEYSLNNIYYLTDRICFTKGNPQTHHLYFIDEESPTFLNWILFKEILNADSVVLNEYCQLKEKLAKLYPNNRIKYTQEKQSKRRSDKNVYKELNY